MLYAHMVRIWCLSLSAVVWCSVGTESRLVSSGAVQHVRTWLDPLGQAAAAASAAGPQLTVSLNRF